MLRLVRIDKKQCLLKLRHSRCLYKINRYKSHTSLFLSRNDFNCGSINVCLCHNFALKFIPSYQIMPANRGGRAV
jgi:hypothetical protein